MDLREKIRNIEGFPAPGVIFRDITTLVGDPEAFHELVDQLTAHAKPLAPDVITVLDARGFLIGSPVAYLLGKGVAPVRKAGKLPWKTYKVEYELEYGSDAFEIHQDAIRPGQRVVILDDLLATGGTAKAACELVEKSGGTVAGLGFVIELTELKGREKLAGYDVFSLVEY